MYGTLTGNRKRPIDLSRWFRFVAPRKRRFHFRSDVTRLKSKITCERQVLDERYIWNTNRKPTATRQFVIFNAVGGAT
jgi:hypothetical protein